MEGPPLKVRDTRPPPLGTVQAKAQPVSIPPSLGGDPPRAMAEVLQQQGTALGACSQASVDFGGAVLGSSRLAAKGSAKREKLQAELGARTGAFMVAVAQGRTDVSFTLSLFPDPPPQVFHNRSAAYNPRAKAWAPLCPALWATTALAYLKETDAIMARRAEAFCGTPAGGQGRGSEEARAKAKVPEEAKGRSAVTASVPGGESAGVNPCFPNFGPPGLRAAM